MERTAGSTARRFWRPLFLGMSMFATTPAPGADDRPDADVRLMTLDPGHFHAALIQKDMYPTVSETVHVYAPLGPDLIGHLQRISGFNRRAERPTSWRLEVHAGPDPLERMLREKPGNVVVLSGRNQGKIDRILASVQAGLNVLADKPWIIDSADFPKLEAALETAERKGLVAYDVMTERYEVTTRLQRDLVQDKGVTGSVVPGTEAEPGIFMESVHHVLKTVAGAPNLRPAWFFDANQQGEALADVGTHLVDLVPWMLFPEQALDHGKDIRLVAAKRWPTVLTRADFGRVTGEAGFPALLSAWVKDDQLQFPANTSVSYVVKGIHAQLKALWNYEAPAGTGDTHHAVVRGSRARVEVRQGPEQKYRPEVYVVPASADLRTPVAAALKEKVARLQADLPGLVVVDAGPELRILIPDRYRTDHESHFAQVTSRFLDYLEDPKTLPRWEKANMLAKYFVTTGGVDLSRRAAR
jgi:predicted dehydrogenase